MKVQRIQLGVNHFSWLVLDDSYLPIRPIQEFTRYLENILSSPNTIRSYAYHLKLFWEFLADTCKDWKTIKINDFAEFLSWLRRSHINVVPITTQCSKRTESNRIEY